MSWFYYPYVEMPKIRELTHEEHVHVVELAVQGFSNRNVASRLGIHHETVSKLLRKKNKFEII